MTAPTESTSVAISDGKLPDLNKPSVAIKFADMWTSGKLDKLSPQQQGVFLVALGNHIGVKAELGDIMLYQGKPYITISGYRRIAHNTGLLCGIQPRPAAERDFRIYGAEAGDYLWLCDVYKKGSVRAYTGWGHVRKNDRNPVTKTHPQEMARKRAVYDALRLAFPPGEVIGDLHMQFAPEAEARAESTAALRSPVRVMTEYEDADLADESDAPPQAVGSEAPSTDDRATEAQVERLLDLIENPAVSGLTREKVQTRLKAGMTRMRATDWIDELERSTAAENEVRAAVAGALTLPAIIDRLMQRMRASVNGADPAYPPAQCGIQKTGGYLYLCATDKPGRDVKVAHVSRSLMARYGRALAEWSEVQADLRALPTSLRTRRRAVKAEEGA